MFGKVIAESGAAQAVAPLAARPFVRSGMKMIGRFLIRRATRPFRRALFLVVVLAIAAAIAGQPKAESLSSNEIEAGVSKVFDGAGR